MPDCEWFYLDASTAKRLKPGLEIRPGEYLGLSARDGRRMSIPYSGAVAEMQYDVETDELIIAIEQISFSSLWPCLVIENDLRAMSPVTSPASGKKSLMVISPHQASLAKKQRRSSSRTVTTTSV